MNYKNTRTGEIISAECYNKLPALKRAQYVITSESATHRVEEDENREEDDDIGSSFSLSLGSDDSPSSSDPSSSFGGFGGGDFEGGGATGSW